MCNVENIRNGRNIQTTKDLNLNDLLNSSFAKLKIIECLISSGVEINLVNKLGETPLHMCRNRDVCKLLLDNGAGLLLYLIVINMLPAAAFSFPYMKENLRLI